MKTKVLHNINRYGEVYDENFLSEQLSELRNIKDKVILSGGWAWHFISPEHIEYKHLHDHTDIDIFVFPNDVLTVQFILKENNWNRIKSKYDSNNFIRYEKISKCGKKMIIDMFIEGVPFITINKNDIWNVVEPEYLLSLYARKLHQSIECIAVQKSKKLKINEIVNNKNLIKLDIKTL